MIGADGTLTGNYSNQQTAALGQIALANFANQNGLVEPRQQRVPADVGNRASRRFRRRVRPITACCKAAPVEPSNVDLTSELVDLITAQRNYQANAQTIKTQQTVDQTLINL